MSQKEATSSTTKDSDSPIGVTGIVGILLLVGGVVAALYAHQNMAGFQSTGGQIVRALSQQQQQEYQTLSIVRIGGVVAAVVGGVLAFADIS